MLNVKRGKRKREPASNASKQQVTIDYLLKRQKQIQNSFINGESTESNVNMAGTADSCCEDPKTFVSQIDPNLKGEENSEEISQYVMSFDEIKVVATKAEKCNLPEQLNLQNESSSDQFEKSSETRNINERQEEEIIPETSQGTVDSQETICLDNLDLKTKTCRGSFDENFKEDEINKFSTQIEETKNIKGKPAIENHSNVEGVNSRQENKQTRNNSVKDEVKLQEGNKDALLFVKENKDLVSKDDFTTCAPQESVTLGIEFDALLRAPDCCGRAPQLAPSQTHTIMFRPYHPSTPYPGKPRHEWDRHHVRMPCSRENEYPHPQLNKLVRRWELICNSLSKPIVSCVDLQERILEYNSHNVKSWNFKTLEVFLKQMNPGDRNEFFSFTLPGIIKKALSLPTCCTQSPPLLKRQKEHTITMSQQQVASLLANAFLCTFPRRNAGSRNPEHEFANYPTINFQRLFQSNSPKVSRRKIEKLKCIVYYFKRALQQPSTGTISFKRQVLHPDDTPQWHSCSTKLCQLRVSSNGKIEDDALGMLQVDFANKFIGGGVLGEGCVQEEIRFAICPEIIVSRLFTERLDENECLIITGAERFSDYEGYASTFQWAREHDDQTPRDSWGRLHTEVVAIDAKPRMTYSDQFSPANIKRELEKAFCGFLSRDCHPNHLPAVATGKWGCGAFNGDPQLKSLIQIMAASAAHRDLLYFTFDDKVHAKELHGIHSFLKAKDITIGELWKLLNKYKWEIKSKKPIAPDLFGYIYTMLGTKNDVTAATSRETSDDVMDRTPEDVTATIPYESSDDLTHDVTGTTLDDVAGRTLDDVTNDTEEYRFQDSPLPFDDSCSEDTLPG